MGDLEDPPAIPYPTFPEGPPAFQAVSTPSAHDEAEKDTEMYQEFIDTEALQFFPNIEPAVDSNPPTAGIPEIESQFNDEVPFGDRIYGGPMF
jgi:hypothetical protein